MANVYEALNDINWLSKRLKGIISLSEEIVSYDTMKQQAAELTNSLAQAKEELLSTNQEKKEVEVKKQELTVLIQKLAKQAEDDYNETLVKAKEEAKSIVNSAQADSADLFNRAEEKRVNVLTKIDVANMELTRLTNAIATEQDKYNKLVQAINALKSKF